MTERGDEQQMAKKDLLIAGNHGCVGLRAPGVGSPLEQGGGQRRGDARLVVGIVRLGGDVVVGVARSGAISTATAGQVMLSTAGKRGAAEGDGDAGVQQGGVERRRQEPGCG